MLAITRKNYCPPEDIIVKDIPKPKPRNNEILVKVAYASVNRTDCGILTGKPKLIRLFTGWPRPKSIVAGSDFSGVVEEVGNEVEDFKIGDRVWGLNDEGLASHAEYLVIKCRKAVAVVPENVSLKDIAACAEGAHYALNFISKVKLKEGQRVLVNGATGGIGSAAVQLLKTMNVHVTAVTNTKNIELVKSLGADATYDFQKQDFTKDKDKRYDFVFDAVGKSSFGQCAPLLNKGGVYISSELGPGNENLYLPLLTLFKPGPRVIFPIPSNHRRTILHMTDLLAQGKFKAVIESVHSPEEIKEVYKYVMSGEKTGQVLLEFSPQE